MTLIRFKSQGHDVYVNPEHVIDLHRHELDPDLVVIRLTHGYKRAVIGTIDGVAAALTAE